MFRQLRSTTIKPQSLRVLANQNARQSRTDANGAESASATAPLSIAELEAGLHMLAQPRSRARAFWDRNLPAFQQTLLFAILETEEALSSPRLPQRLRMEMKGQLTDLRRYPRFAARRIS